MRHDVSPEWVDRLAKGPLLEGVPKAEIAAMLAELAERRWAPRQIVMTPRESLETFCVLLEGRVKITRQNQQTGRELTLFLLGPGDGFNIISLLDGQPHDVTAETLDPVHALCGPVELWQAWMDRHPAFLRAVRRYVDRQMRQLGELASDLALHDTMTRLAHLILRNFEDGQQDPRRDLLRGLSHEELAHLIGTVRVVVNRLLRELREDGVVDCQGGELRVRNLKKLLEIAEGHLRKTGAAKHLE